MILINDEAISLGSNDVGGLPGLTMRNRRICTKKVGSRGERRKEGQKGGARNQRIAIASSLVSSAIFAPLGLLLCLLLLFGSKMRISTSLHLTVPRSMRRNSSTLPFSRSINLHALIALTKVFLLARSAKSPSLRQFVTFS